ncbi:hypothetical protein BST95_10165 [Halioglobus japonicus]|uniref:1-aminocyclopropane-1-carboxylate deaminase n=1 Tax=Halioglobus japonicus TaxID=930805 RepID=A0AAP8SNE7_9GAMM|nr:pyridoxal-phosphate dependent enzyme [Halioglobus japonicus]AQA18543.1 hypothetical protein BST95_10165 [Halioglobus japonicus]PLW86565.1 1-aminocyclopropane-1-carboxylate deaminase [Halioglobus japonicus]GHD12223.1 1-aminocyclopropane-1-carboxylate deaminase [Halioglobus japonicus]
METTSPLPFSSLSEAPVLGQTLGNIDVLRLDQVGARAPGNKLFKLRLNLQRLREQGQTRVLSFGGGWSNHLHALAAVGAEQGLETIGIVRGGETETAMLRDARAWGMQLVAVDRTEYRRRNEPEYQQVLRRRFGSCVVLPEGGANAEAVLGCRAIADAINQRPESIDRVFVPVGSGATLAGLAAALAPDIQLHGISALRGAQDLEARVQMLLTEVGQVANVPWRIHHEFHCGGFARVNGALREFMLDFEAVHAIPLEPVYTAKMFYAVAQLLRDEGVSPHERLVLVHTGGLQGRRGYAWLNQAGDGQVSGT